MRGTLTLLASAVMTCTLQAQQAPPAPQAPPVFRAGVDLVSIDVTALDSNGRQVTDLSANDFQVEIDGQRRQVSTVEYVRSVDPLRSIGAPQKVVVADETFSTSNAKGAPRGRLIVLVIDQGNIRAGSARSSMQSAKKFVDTLTPEDRVAVIAVPSPGELVDFTNNHDKVREALLRVVGAQDTLRARFNISITEAFALYMNSDARLQMEVVIRECSSAGPASLEQCERDVENEAANIVSDLRRRTQDSLTGIRAVLQNLALIDGPKSVILISEGMIFEGLGSEADEIATVAADSRATLDILLLDVSPFDASIASRPNTPREDRELQVTGLEQIAGAARGSLYRINTTAEFAFERISRAIDGYYLLGVESRPEDRGGKRHRIGVRSARKGVSIRSRRSILTSISAKTTTPAEAVARAIRSPLPINDLPLKLSTWTYKEPGGSKVRVLIAAEVERLAGQPLDYTVGLAVVNRQGRGVAPPTALNALAEKAGDAGTALYSSMLVVEPGEYKVVLAMADSEGRVGSVSRSLTAYQMTGPGISMGDLLVGGFDDSGKIALRAAIEPVIAGSMAALLEAYSSQPVALDAMLEILRDENSAPLAAVPMRIGVGSSPEITNASAQLSTAALPPGRYLARATVRQGGKSHGHLLRPFRVVAPSTAAVGAVPASSRVPDEMALLLLGGVANFDRKELLTPAMVTSMLAIAEARPSGSSAAVTQARGGDLGGAAMAALSENDQALANFLKGLELFQGANVDRATLQFQSAMQIAPTFAPARLLFGASLAEARRHKEAAGLIQSAATAPPNATLARIAGEEWIKAGQYTLAVQPLELAVQQPNADASSRKLLGIAYVLGGRPADAATVLSPYLDTNPTDGAALLAAIYSTYQRHLAEPQTSTLATDKTNITKWAKAYSGTKGPLQPLVTAWVQHVAALK